MNELVIILGGHNRLYGNNRLYYKTNQTTRKDALCEFFDTCDKVGINTDECLIEDYILRKNGEDID